MAEPELEQMIRDLQVAVVALAASLDRLELKYDRLEQEIHSIDIELYRLGSGE